MHWHMFRYRLSLALLLRQTLFGTLGRIDSVFRLLALTIDVMIIFTSATLQDEEINIKVFPFLAEPGHVDKADTTEFCWHWCALFLLLGTMQKYIDTSMTSIFDIRCR